MGKRRKRSVNFYLSDEALEKIERLSREGGVSKTSVVEQGVRLYDRQMKQDLPPEETGKRKGDRE